MTSLEATLRQIVADLVSLGRTYALVGGLAVSARADPRLTRGADLVVSVADDDEAEQLIRLLQADYDVLALVEQETTGRMATVRLARSRVDRPVVVDLLFASSGIEPEIAAAAEELEVFPGMVLRVATVGHLLAMKLLARDDRHRPADADDLGSLRSIASEEDWKVAAEAVALIVAREAHRDRDLEGLLGDLRRQGPYA